jgi:large subunit ribosomal protein L4
LIYEAVKNFRANQRRGTASTKTRGKVAGSGRKLWRQKGTGRARIGSIRSPLWRSGGTTFGPQPRDYSYKMPRKARRNALKSVLSDKMRNERIVVVEDIALETQKTKDAVSILKKFEFDKVLIVDKKENSRLILSTRNIPYVKTIDFSEINVYDSVNYNYIMFSVDAVKELVEVLKK